MIDTAKRLARTIVASGGAIALFCSPVAAQDVESFDPDEAYSTVAPSEAIDGDLVGAVSNTSPTANLPAAAPKEPIPVPSSTEATVVKTYGNAVSDSAFDEEFAAYSDNQVSKVAPEWAEPGAAQADEAVAYEEAATPSTYGKDDLIGAAEGVFGKGAEGLARMIEDLLEKQGQPNGYIVGREAGGAFVFGARYGSGTLHHKIEGQRKVYWTGPSVGFDAGANASNTFVLVYNLFDSEELFERYPAGEGQAYLVGGLNASYLRKGDVVLIPIRVGAGLRLGVNAGYLKFSKKQRWLPF